MGWAWVSLLFPQVQHDGVEVDGKRGPRTPPKTFCDDCRRQCKMRRMVIMAIAARNGKIIYERHYLCRKCYKKKNPAKPFNTLYSVSTYD